MTPTYFKTAPHFRRWLQKNHASVPELWVGFYRLDSGRPSITYPEALDQALCFGWIDGIRKKVDAVRYTIRFTPRRPRSIWSTVNIARVEALIKARQMHASGLSTFKARDPKRSGLYSFENRPQAFDAALEKRFRANNQAWAFFDAQPPGYRRLSIFWVMSAKHEETRVRRLDNLAARCAEGRRLGLVTGGAAERSPPGPR